MLILLWGIMWRMVLYGLTFGALFGSLVMLFILPSGIHYGALIGGGIGALLGLADGLAMCSVTYVAPTKFPTWKAYRSAMITAAMSANVACGAVAIVPTSINMSITGRLLELIGSLSL